MQGDSINQANIFLIFILNGMLIGIIFDIFRSFRKSFKTKDFFTYIQDILFWILTGILLIYSIYTFNNGELRLYIFVGIGIGIILYFLLLSKYIININNKTIMLLIKVINIIVYPIKTIFKPFFTFFDKNINILRLKIKKRIKNMTFFKKKVANKEDFKV